ncbi:cyclic nucleotide-binding domain-containing protein [Paenibacillus sp. CGMCC 1.16610]|uniref:Cyclic nucleotide-binding domain-containing protein n=2 Tax=Paenibacillus anseongense TaxID=2682845 RepID=A0ABW9U0H6_9BACL|nr:cyclic nucleotide-binding domain-containing protein [Paenibacillus sp. CGMCC 1.16610]MBA2943017.1 cyclic nucleotide-binding domain-containing protein [Paenibacillus sp. CGMCC 1.16610]MVQ33513.1 cyclic nucleotide-binding domain-containing protein [Paenibacillus anseongense]
MQGSLTRWMGLRTEDIRKLWMMLPIFYFSGIAESLNYTAFMALFNQRFGVQYLPYIYIAEAAIMPLEGWLLAKLANRLPKAKLMTTLYLLMIGLLVLNGAVLLGFKLGGIDFRYYYPIMFISSNFVVRQLTLLLWSTAFDLCPTQQAKRLMPVFIASTTTGGITAGLLAHQIGKLLGTEAVYALAPVLMVFGFIFFRKALARYLVPLTLKEDLRLKSQSGTIQAEEEEQQLPAGYYAKQMLRSPFLLCAVALMTLMPAVYFMIEYQYFTAAEANFPLEGDLTSFYGLITAIQFTFCLLLQTVSTRLMNWLGASNMLLAITVVFFGGFGLTALFMNQSLGLALVSGSYAVFYILLYYIAEPCYQLFFKMMPISKRDGYRYFAQGVAASGGILIGSLLSLLHSFGLIQLSLLAWLGVGLAVILVIVAWYGRHLYIRELVKSVQSLHADLSDIAESFIGGIRSSKALSSMLGYLKHPNDYVRELALEVIGKAKDSAFLPHLIGMIGEESSRIRIAVLRAMNLQSATIQDLVQVASFLEDEDPEVRAESVKLISKATHLKSQSHFFIRVKLLDNHPRVVHEGVKALYSLESEESYQACDEAIIKMLDNGGEWAVYGCHTVADLKLDSYSAWVLSLLDDHRPAVKVAAAACLGKLSHVEAIPILLNMVPLADQELRKAILQALVDMGDKALPTLSGSLNHANPFIWNAAVTALAELLDENKLRTQLVDPCVNRMLASTQERALSEALLQLGMKGLAELANQRCAELHNALVGGAWAVMAKFVDERVVATLREATKDENEEVRENALEVLAEGLGDRKLALALLELLKQGTASSDTATTEPLKLLQEAARWSDDWLKDIAVYALSSLERDGMREERKFLTMLDKVIFLKQVSLFADLSVDELGLIAGIATEEVHEDLTYLLRRGQSNSAMYLIIEGNVELSNETGVGETVTIGVLGPKQPFGETTALDGSPSAVTAQAIFDEVRVLALQGESLSRLVRLYPEIGIGLLHASSARVRLLENMLLKMA